MTPLPLARFSIFVRARFHFAVIGGILQLRRRGATRELEAEFKFQRRSCKFSLLFPPHRQSASENLVVPSPPRFETRQIPAVWINPWYSPTSLNSSSTSRSLSLLPTRRTKECGTMAGIKHWSSHGNSYVWQSHRTSVRTKRVFLRGLLLPRRVQSTPLSASFTVDKC